MTLYELCQNIDFLPYQYYQAVVFYFYIVKEKSETWRDLCKIDHERLAPKNK